MLVTKGKLLGIGLKKQAKIRKGNSSLGYFDLNGKTIIPYNLKHYLRLTTKISPSLMQGISPTIQKTYSEHQGKILLNDSSSLRSKLEKRLQDRQTEISKITDLNGCLEHPLSKIELPWVLTTTKSKATTGFLRHPIGEQKLPTNKASYEEIGNFDPNCSILPHEFKKEQFQKNTWTWLSWSIKNNNPITGRIARSLQRAGICVLIGGFTAFLPYKEYSIRNKMICAKEAELQSFQILNLKRSNLNCVLSKDRVTYKYDRPWKT